MIIEPGEEKRAAERIVRLLKRYFLRFDPPDQARFYTRLVRGLAVPMKSVTEFIYLDDAPAAKKPPQRAGLPIRKKTAARLKIGYPDAESLTIMRLPSTDFINDRTPHLGHGAADKLSEI